MSQISHKTVTEPIAVAGFEIRTSNALELSGQGQIGALWQRFFVENLLARIPNRTSESLYVVYSNYASDENSEYDYLLGAPVSSIGGLPEGVTFEAIATGEYAVITSDRGPVVEVLQAAWKRIWSLRADELGGKRAFLTDYEIYDDRATNPADAVVEIRLGLEATLE
jgi:predicted transcriptional regulator YdeE